MQTELARLLLLASLAVSGPLHAAEPQAVRTAQPAPSAASSSLATPGRTVPAQQAHLVSRATGIIAECRVDIGDRVKADDILAVIAAPEIAHKIAAAQARIAQLKSSAELSKALLKRAETLAATNAFSLETLDERRASVLAAEADQLAAEADLRTLEEDQRFLTIRAPFDGTITARQIDRGDHVNGDSSSADGWLFHIARLNELRMVLAVPPSTALQVRGGQEAEVTFPDLPGKTFPAKVSRLSSLIDSRSGTMQVELSLPNPDFLLPAGLSGLAKIKAPTLSSILLVPSNTVVIRHGVTQVALVEGGAVRFHDVKSGRTLGAQTEILSGITNTSEVIVSPNALLQEGDQVSATPLATAKK